MSLNDSCREAFVAALRFKLRRYRGRRERSGCCRQCAPHAHAAGLSAVEARR